MTTRLVAVRHGETEWNRIGKQQGHMNSGLTELGVKQARAMAEGLLGYGIELCYSSDLGRAVQTAEIICEKLGIRCALDAGLRERHLGLLQGLTHDELQEKHPEAAARMAAHDPDYRIPGGESERDRYTRTVTCVESLAARHPGRTILIVAHGGVLKSFIQKALDLPLDRKRTYSLMNAAINAFSISDAGEWRLGSWGETGHLRTLGLSTTDDW